MRPKFWQNWKLAISIAIIALTTAACSPPAPQTAAIPSPPTATRTITHTPTVTPTHTPTPTITPSATLPPIPTASNTPTPTPLLVVPSATPTPSLGITAGGIQTIIDAAEADGAAIYISQPPKIDGSLDDWRKDGAILGQYRVFTSSRFDGSDDAFSSWWLRYDDVNLYIGVEVIDDIFVQTESGDQVWRGDSIEIQIDSDLWGDPNTTAPSPDDFQILISPGNFANIRPSAYRFRGTGDGHMIGENVHLIQVRSQQTERGYTLEARIPWSDIGLQRPGDRAIIGMSLNLSENDEPNTAIQQAMYSNVPTRILLDPSSWGRIVLIRP